jgi:alginate O-acetyltransferase complex protein AlgI
MFFIPLEGAVKARAMERFWSLFGTYWWLLLICAFCCLPWPVRWIKKYYKTWPAKIILLGLFWFVIYELALSGSGDFLYFRF